MANFLWSGGYLASAANLLSTELNSLATSTANTLSTLGGAIDNSTNGYIYCDIEFITGSTLSPVAGAFIELWFLRSLDGGTNYEDGSSTVAPGRGADAIIPVRSGTTITPRAGISGVILPPGIFKCIARNQIGVTLTASGNTIKYRPYTESI